MRAGLPQALFPFQSGMAGDSRRALGALLPVRARPHQNLLRRGDVAGGVYLIVGGSLRVYYVTDQGREATLYTVEPGGTCVLALTATLSEEPYPAWVDAGSAGGQYVLVPARLVRTLLDAERAFREFVFGALSGRILDLMRTLEEVGSDQVRQRVARYLLRRQGRDGSIRVSQARIAAELGSAREVVFRALRALSARGLVETGRVRIRILDQEGLQRNASGRGPRKRRHACRHRPDLRRRERPQSLRGRR